MASKIDAGAAQAQGLARRANRAFGGPFRWCSPSPTSFVVPFLPLRCIHPPRRARSPAEGEAKGHLRLVRRKKTPSATPSSALRCVSKGLLGGSIEAGSLNGYSMEKFEKRGQECIIEKTFNDKTLAFRRLKRI